MRILFYVSYFHPYISGITIYAQRLASHLALDHKVTVLTFQYKKDLPRSETQYNFHIIRMPYLFKLSKGFISLASCWTYIKTVHQHDIVIITLPNVEALFLALYARMLGKKVITLTQCEIDLGPGIMNSVINIGVSLIGFIQMLTAHQVVGFPDYIPARWFYPYIKHKFTPSLPPIEPLAINVDVYKKLIKKKGENIWIGFVGRIAQEKGLEFLISAVKLLKDDFPLIQLVFIGPSGSHVAGENAYYSRIQHMLKKEKIDHVSLGVVPNIELGATYKALDVLVTPSTNKTEAFGMAQVEAMLTGTPSVTSNLPGMRQPVLLTGMGELVEPENSMSIKNGIEKIMKNRAHYTTREKVHTAHKVFDLSKVHAFYDDLLA